MLGFVANRHDHHYVLPVDPQLTGLGSAALPDGLDIITAADAHPDRLMAVDELLRQDVPGTAGWRNDPEDFRASTFGSHAFDPATYLVAVDERDGEYVGLCRVWWNDAGPRAGMVGVIERCRRRGLARALVAQVWDVVRSRGEVAVTAEVDASNVASNALCSAIGGERVGGSTELVLRHGSGS
jgi:ribosomal protein S18 acetylase RimI-like enzyme